jgi:hypothetical protein
MSPANAAPFSRRSFSRASWRTAMVSSLSASARLMRYSAFQARVLQLLDVCEQPRVGGLRESCGADEEPEEGNDLKGLHFLMASTLQR